MDTKAKVKIGEFSRNGKTRTAHALEGLDHDYAAKETLVPLGILNLQNDCTDIIFGTSTETSDFIVDGLEIWWDKNKADYSPTFVEQKLYFNYLKIIKNHMVSISSKYEHFVFQQNPHFGDTSAD